MRASAKWSMLAEAVSRSVQPLVFVILARLLEPEDFGVVGTALVAVGFAQMFWDAGLAKALIQTNAARDPAANVVFWTNLGSGVVLCGVLALAAPILGDFFRCPETVPVLRVLSLLAPIASIGSVHQALLTRDFEFRKVFWTKLLVALVPGLFSIPAAAMGVGVWALVVGYLLGQAANTLLLWRMSGWRPSLSYDWAVSLALFRFGGWVLAEAIGAWLILWGDSLVVGRYLGVAELGLYRTGSLVVSLVFGLALNPLVPILYPAFSRMRHDHVALLGMFRNSVALIMVISLPMGAGLFLVGPELAGSIFGHRWLGLAQVVSVLGLTQGVSWMVGVNTEAFRAIGRPDVNTKILFLALLYYLPSYFLAAQHGLAAFLWTRFATAAVSVPLHVFFCRRHLGLPLFYLLVDGRSALRCTIGMVCAVGWLKYWISGSSMGVSLPAQLVLLVSAGVLSYSALMYLTDRAYVTKLLSLLRRAASR